MVINTYRKKTTFNIDFIGIGVEKSATTWLATCLADHPEIFIPKKKEVYFFNQFDPHYLSYEGFNYRRGLKWYEDQFKGHSEWQLLGEFTPTYLYCDKAAERIAKNFPNVKFIIILRNPVSRAFSQYIHDIRLGLLTNETFEEALKSNFTYIEKGMYYKHLQRYFDIYERENIGIFWHNEALEDPILFIRKLYEFLGIKDRDYISPCIKNKSNSASKPIFPLLNSFMINFDYFLRKNNLNFITDLIIDLKIREVALYLRDLNSVAYNKHTYPEMRAKTKKILKEIFKPDVLKLEKMLKKDLSSWYK